MFVHAVEENPDFSVDHFGQGLEDTGDFLGALGDWIQDGDDIETRFAWFLGVQLDNREFIWAVIRKLNQF